MKKINVSGANVRSSPHSRPPVKREMGITLPSIKKNVIIKLNGFPVGGGEKI